MLLDDIKTLLEIEPTDTSQDSLLALYIRRAVYTIKNYINNEKLTSIDIEVLYPEAVLSLVVNARRLETTRGIGIKSETQGARSITYSDEKSFLLSDDIKAILPTPYIRMR